MIRGIILVAVVAAFTAGTAYAQAPVQLRGGGMQGQRVAPTWRIGPDGVAHFAGIDAGTVLGTQTVGQILGQISAASSGLSAVTSGLSAEIARVTAAESALVPLKVVGQPGGVAALDAAGNMPSPINTIGGLSEQGSLSHGYQATIPLQFPGNGWEGDAFSHEGGPRITLGAPEPFMADNMALFGGHRLYDSVFSKFYALPYGVGDDGGCVHSSVMSGSPLGGANCGAGGWDAVDEYEFAGNQMPWYVTGQDFPDENGVVHTVTFTANGATVRPALPDSYRAQMHGNMHVMTNIVAGPVVYSGIQLLDPDPTHRNADYQLYGNTLAGWSDGSDAAGTFTQFTMSGQWEPLAGGNVDDGHAPAVGSVNRASSGQTDSLDQSLYGEFTHPFIEFGTYYKAFTRNTTCSIIARNDVDQGTNMRRLGPARKCDEELDNWYHGPAYGATMHGLTIGAGFDNPVSMDSYGLDVAGPWPTGVRTWLGSFGVDFDGDEYVTGSRVGSPGVVGSQKMIAEWWQEPTANIGYLEAVKLWSQTDSVSEPHNPIVGGPAANGQDVSYWFGPRQSSSKYHVDGNFESAIAFNPAWAKNGIALCGANAAGFFGGAYPGTACLSVDTWGNTHTTGTLSADGEISAPSATFSRIAVDFLVPHTPGGDIVLSGNIRGYDSSVVLNWLATNSLVATNSGGSIAVGSPLVSGAPISATSFSESLTTPSSSSAPCTAGQFTDDANYHYVCVATNTWKRAALSGF